MADDFMSADAQNRLLSIAKQAVERARDGEGTPSEALAKLAADHQLNADEIHRVKEAINTAAVLALRKRASGEGSPDDVIPLVNSEEVLGRVFRQAPKPDDLALAKVAGEIGEETRSFRGRAEAPALMKTAAAAPRSPRDGLTREQLYDRVHGQIGQLKIAAEIHREDAAARRFSAERRIGDVLDVFRGTAAPAFAEVEKVASALYPEEGLGLVFDMIYRGGELDKIGQRRHTGELPKYASVDEHAEIISKIKAIRDDIGHSLLAKIAEDEVRAKAERGAIEIFKLAEEDSSGFNPFSMVSPALGAATNALGNIGETALGAAQRGAPTVEGWADQLTPRNAKGSTNDRLKSELSNDRTRVVLTKVMNEDPVVSKYPRADVAQAYNEITTLQPALSSQPLALRAALRRYLVSGGDFTVQEAGQIHDFNKEQDKLKSRVGPEAMAKAPRPATKAVAQ